MKSYELGQLIENKRREAEKVINCCKSMNGFYASCDTYFGQYWLRDMVYVIKPLLTRDYSIEVSNQLPLFANKQKKDGDIQ